MIALWASFRLYIIAAVVVALFAGAVWFGVHERHVGAAKVQAQWDVAKAAQASLASKASESARSTERQQATDFAGIEQRYLEATHAKPTFDLTAALAGRAIRLRNDCPALPSGSVSKDTARSRELDAASTQRLADRAENSILAVRAGDAADSRERQLSAHVTALQDVLRAERKQ